MSIGAGLRCHFYVQVWVGLMSNSQHTLLNELDLFEASEAIETGKSLYRDFSSFQVRFSKRKVSIASFWSHRDFLGSLYIKNIQIGPVTPRRPSSSLPVKRVARQARCPSSASPVKRVAPQARRPSRVLSVKRVARQARRALRGWVAEARK